MVVNCDKLVSMLLAVLYRHEKVKRVDQINRWCSMNAYLIINLKCMKPPVYGQIESLSNTNEEEIFDGAVCILLEKHVLEI